MTIASVQNVSFRYPGYEHWILKDFSLELYDREVLAIIGKSGCGKSTLIRLISGLLMPTKGQIQIESNRRVGVVFQDHGSGIQIGLDFRASGCAGQDICLQAVARPLSSGVRPVCGGGIHFRWQS